MRQARTLFSTCAAAVGAAAACLPPPPPPALAGFGPLVRNVVLCRVAISSAASRAERWTTGSQPWSSASSSCSSSHSRLGGAPPLMACGGGGGGNGGSRGRWVSKGPGRPAACRQTYFPDAASARGSLPLCCHAPAPRAVYAATARTLHYLPRTHQVAYPPRMGSSTHDPASPTLPCPGE